MLPTGPAAPRLPARVLTAANADRTDQILYWTRIGEAFPDSGREQRLAEGLALAAGQGLPERHPRRLEHTSGQRISVRVQPRSRQSQHLVAGSDP